mmetsp:Transcript_56123/g.99927  ORF Transcript_56123/g.99927 Transcript_56123/m.99927 type:complete len:378 (+) Transcript_56123:41-1174(+)|eukprot:CAMPEP_0197654726 /NCGR_PEP_ID=MMETSP1338-20131121/39019_1 /TAXON_ID=43686 ORGANISM="Pelagodinium beii, Strain RCC1491" /NCGR_SAMPLE_ID=MMETSP1338 /ASSEMBLY_ACC=CAM_ASM_000754 /LENGTH=377 /DNA_ID=CAMNT_0043230221 /DNA_START=32 /DNA_END=1165 /DNA_ORIENTATION=+
MTATETQSRRLTVLKEEKQDTTDKASLSAASAEQQLKDAGLSEVFHADQRGTAKAVCIWSETDWDLDQRDPYVEKDVVKMFPLDCDDAAKEEYLALVQSTTGFVCKKGKKDNSANQDSFSVLVVEGKFALYGVYDGHGKFGHHVSARAKELMTKLFLEHPQRESDPEAAFREVFPLVHKGIEQSQDISDVLTSGSTCTMAYHDMVRETLTTAHVGDSRSILCRDLKAEELTQDHKPDLPAERQRIESANPPGRVEFDGHFNYRVFPMDKPYPGLNMSRALGDVTSHREAGLSAEPDVRTLDLKAEIASGIKPLILLLCSDGVWEFLESSKVAIWATKTEQTVLQRCERLASESYKRWMDDSGQEVADDITAILVQLA